MDLKEYFEKTEGIGILSTADEKGDVDSAIYARPRITGPDTLAFLMRPRRSYANLQTNPRAVYMFIEHAPGYRGKRIYLDMIDEESDPNEIEKARQSDHAHGVDAGQAKLVTFQITGARPLVGDQTED